MGSAILVHFPNTSRTNLEAEIQAEMGWRTCWLNAMDANCKANAQDTLRYLSW
jgi:hypothetical protein